MNLGLIGAIGGLGSGASQVGKKYMDDDAQKERDERLYAQQADLEAKRQAFQERLQMNSQAFHRQENIDSRIFTAQQNAEIRAHAERLQQKGLDHASALAEAQREMQVKLAGMHEAGADRRHRESQQTARDAQGQTVTGADGNLYNVRGADARPVTVPGDGGPGDNVRKPLAAAPKPREVDYAGLSKAIETINEEIASMKPDDPARRAREIERDSLRAQMLGRNGPAAGGAPGSGTASIVAGAASKPVEKSKSSEPSPVQMFSHLDDYQLEKLAENNPAAERALKARRSARGVVEDNQRMNRGQSNYEGNLDDGR